MGLFQGNGLFQPGLFQDAETSTGALFQGDGLFQPVVFQGITGDITGSGAVVIGPPIVAGTGSVGGEQAFGSFQFELPLPVHGSGAIRIGPPTVRGRGRVTLRSVLETEDEELILLLV